MADKLLDVNGLTVSVEEKEILHDINLSINKGETHVLMGPNGAGKSTLGYALMGNPKYTVKGGSINFAGEDITKLAVDKRAKAGLFLSFQNPLEVPGISLSSFLKTALEQQRGVRIKAWDFRKELRQAMALLQMDSKYAERDLNTGFSGSDDILTALFSRRDMAEVEVFVREVEVGGGEARRNGRLCFCLCRRCCLRRSGVESFACCLVLAVHRRAAAALSLGVFRRN